MTPIAKNIIDDAITAMGIKDFGKATIREIVAIAQTAEKASGQEFVKMEMGVPGLQPSKFGVEAQVKALQDGIARLYPNINGLPELKNEASRFVKAFIGLSRPSSMLISIQKGVCQFVAPCKAHTPRS